MINLFKRKSAPPEEAEEKLPVRAWLIDPVSRSITEIDKPHLPSLINENVGNDAEPYKLDINDNVVWVSDTDTNKRFSYSFEGMCYPLDVKRYSKAVVESMGPNYWSVETILDWLRWHDKQDPWGYN